MRKAIRSVKDVVYQFSDIELQVRAATNNDRFMVGNSQLAAIARATNDYQEYPALFAMLWKRLTDLEHVMHVQKALFVCEYLLRHGAERFINDAKRRARDIAALQKYKHYDETNQDDAKEARAKAKTVYALLMDDQLLAQERAKSARLASEGRLGGHEGYDDEENGGNGASAAPASRPVALQRQRSFGADDDDDGPRPAYSARSAGHAPAPKRALSGGSMRRRSLGEEDPFTTPVIPAASAAAAAPAAPRARASITKPAAAAASKQVGLEVDEPNEDGGGGDESADAAAKKAAKKEKKRKKKEEEARKAASEAASAPAVKATPHRGSVKGAGAGAGAGGGADVDLLSYHDRPNAGEIDFLSGRRASSAAGPGGAGGADLADLFAGQSIHDNNNAGPLWSQGGGAQQQDDPFGQRAGSEIEGDVGHAHHLHVNGSIGGAAHMSPPSPHVLHSPTAGGLVNLDDISAPRARQAETVDSGVSMSMMRSIQPLGANASAAAASGSFIDPALQKKRSNVPSAIPLAGQSYQLQGFMQHPSAFGGGMPPPQLGPAYPMMGGYPGGPMMHPMYQQQQFQAQQPMLAIMPPGMSGAGVAPPVAYGAPGLPFPSASQSTFTQMRQAPKQPGGPVIFDVPEARVQAVEPVDYRTPQQAGGGGSRAPAASLARDAEYKTYYGVKQQTPPRF